MGAVVRPPKYLPNADPALEACLQQFAVRTAFTISSSREPDMPIIYVSQEFCKMTGYTEKEILGRNCRFLQGPGTSRQAVQELRNCIQEDRGCTVCLMNYTKDGKPFWNQLCLAPVRDDNGVCCYLGIQTNVTGAVLAYRSRQFSLFQTQTETAGPHGGVHSFNCPEIVAKELEAVERLEGTIKRWHSEKLELLDAEPTDFRPISSKALPSSLLAPLHKLQQSFVLADPNLPDMPIVHASEGFLKLTGRPRNQVVGHNCRFMQGPLTDPAELQRLRDAIKEQRPITVRLLNYRADGELFWNHLHVAPIRNADGKLDITRPSKKQDRRHSAETHANHKADEAARLQSLVPSSGPDMHTIPEGSIASETALSANNKVPAPMASPHARPRKELNGLLTVLHSTSPPTSREPEQTHILQKEPAAVIKGRAGTAASRQVPEAIQLLSPASKQQQRSVIGTVRVVCRSLSTKTGLRRSLEDQHLPHGVNDCATLRAQLSTDPTIKSAIRGDVPTLGSSHI